MSASGSRPAQRWGLRGGEPEGGRVRPGGNFTRSPGPGWATRGRSCVLLPQASQLLLQTRDHHRGCPRSRGAARSVSASRRGALLLPGSHPSLLPPPSPRPNSGSSCEAPAPPTSSALAHWLKPQGRVPGAGGSHWWAEPSEFPDEGTFCRRIKGAGKAGDSAV